jgi:ketosteroid isomerase-like protein
VDVARRYSDALRAGDYATAESLLDPEVEIQPPSGRPYGLPELQEAWASGGFDHLLVALENREFEPEGDDVLLRADQVFSWKEEGAVAYSRPFRARYSFRDGRIVRVEMEVG